MKNKIRIVAATPNIEVGQINYNAERIVELMTQANNNGAHLLCLPKLCLSGYSSGDLLLFGDSQGLALNHILQASKDMDVTVLLGMHPILPVSPAKNNGEHKPLNLALPFAQESANEFLSGQTSHKNDTPVALAIIYKGDVQFMFDGAQNSGTPVKIVPNQAMELKNLPGVTFALDGPNMPDADIIINLTAEHEIIGLAQMRRQYAVNMSQTAVYVQSSAGYGESTTDGAFAGHNIIAYGGTIVSESPPFGHGHTMADVELTGKGQAPKNGYNSKGQKNNYAPYIFDDSQLKALDGESPTPFIDMCKCPATALDIQANALARRLLHTKASCCVIGISGGLDSCLALLVTVRACKIVGLGASKIKTITMPCFGTTEHTKTSAILLCNALGVPCTEIDITKAVSQHLRDINHPKGQYDITFENAQARMRTMVLMNIANQQNGLVIGTGSLSELALGWATFGGDHISMYNVNIGVPKTLVRHLVTHLANNPQDLFANCTWKDKPTFAQKVGKFRPNSYPPPGVKFVTALTRILDTPVSPELLPTTQHTEDFVGPYQLHDFFIYHILQMQRPANVVKTMAEKIFEGSYTKEAISHWLQLFLTRFISQQFKRNCIPDGPQVVGVSLSPRTGIKLPSDGSIIAS